MLRNIFTLLLLALCTQAGASHLMGGEITAKQISGLDYEITLTLYRDVSGVNLQNTASVELRDTARLVLQTLSLDTFSVRKQVGIPYGIDIYTYRDTITFSSAGTYILSYGSCCRNILVNASNGGTYLETRVLVNPTNGNSSPIFHAPPTNFARNLTTWSYNPAPLDLDGDSLAWEIAAPWQSLSPGMTPQNLTNWVLPISTSTGPFVMDSVTGQITWTPNMLGNHAFAIQVKEYRNGVLIGELRRDLQIIVINPLTVPVSPPAMAGFKSIPKNASGNHQLNFNHTQKGTFGVSARSTSTAPNSLDLQAFGEPFVLDANPATYSKIVNPNLVEGTIDWTPTLAEARTRPYIISFKASESVSSVEQTVIIYVGSFTNTKGIEVVYKDLIYPNPSSGDLYIELDLEREEMMSFELIDLNGKLIWSKKYSLNSGISRLDFGVEVNSGTYILNILGEKALRSSSRIVIN